MECSARRMGWASGMLRARMIQAVNVPLMSIKNWSWSALAALVGGAQWVWIPLVYSAYPWGAAGNRAYGYFDFLLFTGPLLWTAALPGLFRCYGSRSHQPQQTGRFGAMTGGVLLVLASFGYGYGSVLEGVGLASPLLLLSLLLMSVGFLVLSRNIIRTGSWARWSSLPPLAIAAVPLVWLATVLFVGVVLRRLTSGFFDASFTALIVSFGAVWMLQAFALGSESWKGDEVPP